MTTAAKFVPIVKTRLGDKLTNDEVYAANLAIICGFAGIFDSKLTTISAN